MPDALHLALALIRGFEEFRAHAYPDPATGAEPWTVGYGATGPGIGPDTVWSEAEAEADLERRVEPLLAQVRKLAPTLPDGAAAACVSLGYNVGAALDPSQSHLARYLASGDFELAAAEFPKWDYAAGRENSGLLKRRLVEERTFRDALSGAGSCS